MLTKLCVPAAVAAVLFTVNPALANEVQTPSFNHLGGGYTDFDLEGGNIDGFNLLAEYAFSEKLFFTAKHMDLSDSQAVSMNGNSTAIDSSMEYTHANLGYQFYNTGATVAYVSAGYTRIGVDNDIIVANENIGNSSSESGWNAQVGVRHLFTNAIEVDASVRHVDVADESDQEFGVQARYYFKSNFSLFAGYTYMDSDVSAMSIGASYHF